MPCRPNTGEGRWSLSSWQVFVGLDVGKSEHHCVALNAAGDRLVDRPLPNDEKALRVLLGQLARHGLPVVVVDQPASIGALPVAVAQAMGGVRWSVQVVNVQSIGGCTTMSSSNTDDRISEQVSAIIEQAQAEGLQLTGEGGLLPGMIKQAVEAALQAEMADHLGYERHEAAGRGSGNSRNGTTAKTAQTTAGPVGLDVPRDRNGSFEPVTVPKGTRRLTDFDDMIISLFAKGMTTRDIAEHLQVTYGASVSHETVANITDAINAQVTEWRNRPLDEVYPILYIDAIRLRIRDGAAVRIKACHLAVGVDVDGVKRVLGMWIEATEGARFWTGVLTELRNRGIRDVLIVCCDGLKGLPEAITAVWPKAIVQTCVVHLIRNSMRYASWKDRKAIAACLRPIYTAPTAEAAAQALEAFADSEVGRRSPAVVDAS